MKLIRPVPVPLPAVSSLAHAVSFNNLRRREAVRHMSVDDAKRILTETAAGLYRVVAGEEKAIRRGPFGSGGKAIDRVFGVFRR